MASYRVLIVKEAENDLEKFDPVAKKRIKKAILKLAENPHANSKKLTSSQIGQYRFRVGRYRIIFDLDKDKIVLLRIGHRREIYR